MTRCCDCRTYGRSAYVDWPRGVNGKGCCGCALVVGSCKNANFVSDVKIKEVISVEIIGLKSPCSCASQLMRCHPNFAHSMTSFNLISLRFYLPPNIGKMFRAKRLFLCDASGTNGWPTQKVSALGSEVVWFTFENARHFWWHASLMAELTHHFRNNFSVFFYLFSLILFSLILFFLFQGGTKERKAKEGKEPTTMTNRTMLV